MPDGQRRVHQPCLARADARPTGNRTRTFAGRGDVRPIGNWIRTFTARGDARPTMAVERAVHAVSTDMAKPQNHSGAAAKFMIKTTVPGKLSSRAES